MHVRKLILKSKVETPGHVQTSRDHLLNIDVETERDGIRIPCKLRDGTPVDQFVPWGMVLSMLVDKPQPKPAKPTKTE